MESSGRTPVEQRDLRLHLKSLWTLVSWGAALTSVLLNSMSKGGLFHLYSFYNKSKGWCLCFCGHLFKKCRRETDGSVNDTVFIYWSVCISLFHLTVESVERESEENSCKTTEMY